MTTHAISPLSRRDLSSNGTLHSLPTDSDNAYSTYPLPSENNARDESLSNTSNDRIASISIANKQNQFQAGDHGTT